AVLVNNGPTDFAFAFGVGMRGESAGPGDVTVAGRIDVVAAFAENPLGAGVAFAEGEVIGRDVFLGFRKALFGDGELVHEGEPEVALFCREIHGQKPAGILSGGFPTNLASEAGLIACGLHGMEMREEIEEDGFEEV